VIDGLRPYPEYSHSDVPWAPVLPKGWRTERAKWLFAKMDRPVRPEDDVVTCFRDGTVTLRKNRRLRGFTEATVEHGYQGIRKGDLVIHQMDAFAGAVGVSDSDGKSTPVYSVCQPKPGINARYYAHAVREMSNSQWILALAKGIRERSTDFRYDMFGSQRLPVPAEEEQAAIVRFLDSASSKVSNFVLAKRKQIARLNEQKQVIIQRAVTRGIDPTTEFKESAIPWVGRVPSHWNILRAKYLFREVDERSESGNEELLSVSHLTGVSPRSEKNITMFKAASYVGHKVCRQGDLAVNTMWAWMGALGVARQVGIISPAYAVYRVRSGHPMMGSYVELLLRTRAYTSNFTCHSTGVRASRLRLYPEEFFRIPVLIPPIDEQNQIVGFINGETSSLDTAIARIEREIALMREYRVRLTSDIVAGKLDVREAAATLPEPLSDAEYVDDAGMLEGDSLDSEIEDSDE